jgi:hypothetical protein
MQHCVCRNLRAFMALSCAWSTVGLASGAFGRTPIWVEPRDTDAGAFVTDAQIPEGSGEVQLINGRLSGLRGIGIDSIDVFAIAVTTPTTFRARTIAGDPELTDTNLWLFNALGRGVLGNRDEETQNGMARLLGQATDGTFTLTNPGLYFIAITGGSLRPTSNAGQIFDFNSPFEISGPDGPGGSNLHNGWSGVPQFGGYTIELQGVSFIPGPATPCILMLAAIGLRRRR